MDVNKCGVDIQKSEVEKKCGYNRGTESTIRVDTITSTKNFFATIKNALHSRSGIIVGIGILVLICIFIVFIVVRMRRHREVRFNKMEKV